MIDITQSAYIADFLVIYSVFHISFYNNEWVLSTYTLK